jgi:RNA recognition motif-containing protein
MRGPFQQQGPPGGKGGMKGGRDGGGNKGGGFKGNRQSDKGGSGPDFGQRQQQQFQPPTPGVNPNGTANWSYGQSTKGAIAMMNDPRAMGGPKGMDGGKGMKGGKGMPGMPFGKGGEQSDVHSNVFVGNLQSGTSQEQLEAAFTPFGPIQSCFVAARDGRSYGFVKFAGVDSATRAISSFNGQNGWIVKMANKDMGGPGFGKGDFGKGKVDSAPPANAKPTHTNVFVGNLKEGLTDAQLAKVFQTYGVVDSCVVMNKGEDKTFGFVEFSTIQEAQTAIEGMNGQEGLVVKFSNNDNVPMTWDASVPHSNLFVGSLPKGMSESELRKIVERHGSVQSCTVKSDPEADKCFGFVKLTTIAAARRAIKALHDKDGWTVKCANHDVAGGGMEGPGGKGGMPGMDGKGMFGGKGMFPPFFGFPGKGGKGGGWVWADKTENERPEPEPHDNLYVKNLPPGIKEEEVTAAFAKIGEVVECRVLSWDGVSECAALVRMGSVEQATQAKAEYNGKVHENCRQTLSVALQKKQGESVPDHVFIKGLHCTTTQDQLKEVFGKVGDVKWAHIMPLSFWPTPGKLPESSGLVQFATPEEAQAAIAEFDGKVGEFGVRMSVRYASEKAVDRPEATPNSNLYVKGWPVGFPDFLLQSVFQSHGQVIRLRLLDNPDPAQPTQAALVQMAKVEDASSALKALHGHTAAVPVPAMRVKHAGRDGTPTGNLYVTSLPRTISEQQIRDTFKNFGEVKRLRLLNQDASPELRALVELSTPELAQQAVRQLDNTAPVFKGPVLYVQYATRREGGKGGSKGD